MDSRGYNFEMEDQKPIFSSALDEDASTAEGFIPSETRNLSMNGSESSFTPSTPYQAANGNDLLNLLSQQEPRTADPAPSVADMDELLTNFRMNGSDVLYDDNPYNMGNRSETGTTNSNAWNGFSMPTGTQNNRNGEMVDTFDFLIKSLSSANHFVSMLTREQLSVLRCIRPSLLYEFLQEIARVRSDKRMRRALPNECAFCKNNGENEECYSSHALKDWRGRVLCPVLRAFRCPRCGATGDRAHTIKYCPENHETGSERSGVSSLSSRRRVPSTASLLLGAPVRSGMPPISRTPQSCPPTPAASAPSLSPTSNPLSHSSLWSFGFN